MIDPTEAPVIAVSLGDPLGIGPEVVAAALVEAQVRDLAAWVIVGDERVVRHAAARVGLPIERTFTGRIASRPTSGVSLLHVAGAPDPLPAAHGPTAACGQASLDYIRVATELCLDGVADGMVTGPVSKEAVTLAGRSFTGHTEYLAELCGADESRMLLANDKMRVVHVTTHCSLVEAANVGAKRVVDTIVLGHEAMRRMGWERPRIAVCGMNPHAGENGLFGDQESRVIQPAVEAARARGIDSVGPQPADTLFLQAYRGRYDLVVAMYHDQGHVPMKLMDFENTVNISLGLPIVRTSVDHGTAYDIAGQGIADPTDMKAAMRFALRLIDVPAQAT
ncbi:4-hydroxythreonine-4-phosphate dehydrogenase PdxA [Botrimarina sp.]|uniref:4-hydroxythreonine-4-phosphate dehydrogenase PdxA n=1 Tax=Botrimarina sp. TaxID=2795802 RepID=UPI0032EC0D41